MKNWERCKHATKSGQRAVYVEPGCRMMHIVKGVLCTTKRECEKCEYCEVKDEQSGMEKAEGSRTKDN